MTINDRIDQSLIELGHKVYSALYPFAEVYFSRTGAYWFEVIFLLFLFFFFSSLSFVVKMNRALGSH